MRRAFRRSHLPRFLVTSGAPVHRSDRDEDETVCAFVSEFGVLRDPNHVAGAEGVNRRTNAKTELALDAGNNLIIAHCPRHRPAVEAGEIGAHRLTFPGPDEARNRCFTRPFTVCGKFSRILAEYHWFSMHGLFLLLSPRRGGGSPSDLARMRGRRRARHVCQAFLRPCAEGRCRR
ncbi:hypothetical protein RHECNPAF_13300175 [Rhizobium etli CNPAF512]|nr:hypothetical protein RHECNPAF_13300175 [Rhizobium etli CNPAF512]